jgi:MFS family permease
MKIAALIVRIYLPAFLMLVGWSMVLPITPLFARDLGASLGIVSLVIAAKGIGPLLLNIPSGMLISRYGNRLILVFVTILALLTAIATGLTRSIAFFAVMTLFRGGLEVVWMTLRVNFIRTLVPVEQRGRAIASMGGIYRIAGFFGPIIGGIIGKYIGLANVFFFQAIIILFVMIPMFASRKIASAQEPPPEEKGEGFSSVLKMLGDHKKSFFTVGVVTIAFGAIRMARPLIFPLWGEQIGLDVAQIGLILGLISAIDMTLFFPAGMIMDRKGRKWAAIPALLIMALSHFLLPAADSFAILLLIGLVNGVGNGLASGIVMTMGSDLAPERRAGEFLSLWFLFSSVGRVFGPSIIGLLSDVFTLGAASIVSAGIGVAGAAFMLFFVADTLKKKAT